MTKNEIIAKTLKEIGFRLEQREETYSDNSDLEEIAIAALPARLPESDIQTCEDFRHLQVECCETCHQFYPHYDMNVLDFGGAKAWVCDPVKGAIYSESLRQAEQR
jgi:hypothetical protein